MFFHDLNSSTVFRIGFWSYLGLMALGLALFAAAMLVDAIFSPDWFSASFSGQLPLGFITIDYSTEPLSILLGTLVFMVVAPLLFAIKLLVGAWFSKKVTRRYGWGKFDF